MAVDTLGVVSNELRQFGSNLRAQHVGRDEPVELANHLRALRVGFDGARRFRFRCGAGVRVGAVRRFTTRGAGATILGIRLGGPSDGGTGGGEDEKKNKSGETFHELGGLGKVRNQRAPLPLLHRASKKPASGSSDSRQTIPLARPSRDDHHGRSAGRRSRATASRAKSETVLEPRRGRRWAVDRAGVSDTVSHMKISTRSLVREFPKAKAAARKGRTVEIVDGKTGEHFILTAKPTRTFGELAAGAKGAYQGPRDLSSREGFGG